MVDYLCLSVPIESAHMGTERWNPRFNIGCARGSPVGQYWENFITTQAAQTLNNSITKELANGHKPFDGRVRNVNGKLPIHDNE